MATLTNEQIEAKKQQLKQLTEEVKQLQDELAEAGALELSEDELDKAAGGAGNPGTINTDIYFTSSTQFV